VPRIATDSWLIGSVEIHHNQVRRSACHADVPAATFPDSLYGVMRPGSGGDSDVPRVVRSRVTG
jgi:hypothetical protein